MFKKVIVLSALAATVMLAGCTASGGWKNMTGIPLESSGTEAATKAFPNPPNGMAGLYVYRSSNPIGTYDRYLKVILDGNFIGGTVQNVYFYKVISPGQHRVDTETTLGQASPVIFNAEAGHNYFVNQDMGARNDNFMGRTAIKMVDEVDGKKGVLECRQAK